MAQEASFAGRKTFTEKLNWCFENVRDDNGKLLSRGAAARHLTKVTGKRHSTTFITNLIEGKQTKPRIDIAAGLASFFGKPSAYFLDDFDEPVVQVAMRAVELDDEDLAAVNRYIDTLRARSHG